MKFKTFEKTMNEIKEYLESLDRKEKLLESLYGTRSDNEISSEYHFVEKIIDITLEDLKAPEWVSDLLWDILTDSVEEDYYKDGAHYECNLKNVWLLCKGKLDERYSVGFEEDELLEDVNNDQESYINQTLSSIFLDINSIKEDYLFEPNNEKTRMKIKGDIFGVLLKDYINTKKINDFNIDFDISEGKNIILISIQTLPQPEKYTLRIEL
jgi:hypothetical protein